MRVPNGLARGYFSINDEIIGSFEGEIACRYGNNQRLASTYGRMKSFL